MPVDNISIMYSAWGATETRAQAGQVACVPQDNLSCLQTTKPCDNFGITLEQIGDKLSCLQTTKPRDNFGITLEKIGDNLSCLRTTKPLATLG